MTTFSEAAELIRLKTGRKPSSMAEVRQILASTPGKGVGSGITLANQGGMIQGFNTGGLGVTSWSGGKEVYTVDVSNDPAKETELMNQNWVKLSDNTMIPRSTATMFDTDGSGNFTSDELSKFEGVVPVAGTSVVGSSPETSGSILTTPSIAKAKGSGQLDAMKDADNDGDIDQEDAQILIDKGEVYVASLIPSQEKVITPTDEEVAEEIFTTVFDPVETNTSGQGSGQAPVITGTNTPAYVPLEEPFVPAYNPPPITGGVGTTEVDVGANYNPIANQAADFAQRGQAQQSFMLPQTVSGQQAQGVGDFSGKIEQKMYKNRQGMIQYITHIDGKPQQAIPPGFSLVQEAAQGMYVQGYEEGGFNVNKPLQTGAATLTKEQLGQAQDDLSAQAFVNPAGSITSQQVAYQDPNAAGTVLSGNTGQALPTAPIVDANQISLVGDVTQATMPKNMTPQFNPDGTPMTDAEGNPVYKDTGFKPATAVDSQTDINQMSFAPATSEYTSQPVIGSDGKPVMENVLDGRGRPIPATDGEGKPIVDSNNMPIYKQQPKMQTALSDAATITGQQATGTSVSDVQAAQLGQPILNPDGTPVLDAEGKLTYDDKAQTVQDAPTRTLQETREPLKDDKGETIKDADGNIMYKGSELVSGSAVDQTKVGDAFGTSEIAAASVQDELSTLMDQFEGGNTPAWAAGSMRKANQILAARGLGASSMAGQAVIQAAMEAALPIAQIDAGNKQQMALFKGEQRAKFLQIEFDQDFQAKVINASKVSEIANMNFNADQQIALENARMAQTVDLANLSNSQAVVMAEAASLANLDMANLSNLQQAAVQNAQNFLQMDMTNLANSQQMEMFKQQTLANSILSDTAAENAMTQFNATSEQQRDQFMTSMASQVSQFNTAQTNAMKQFNANESNAMAKYNSQLQDQREMFNAQQYSVIAQANAKWRQDTTTLNTAAANTANSEYAKNVNGLTVATLDQIWQRERDLMGFAFTGAESAMERSLKVLLGEKGLESMRMQIAANEDQAKTAFYSDFLFGTGNSVGDMFGKDGFFGSVI
jgi:hypothetical protein